ncbi:restriction endonuclease subunit S [Aeromonas veronii]|uniref:restriction endonuclease subunit S n=1 Tax=Aeromonas sp. R10-2 TaxID=3138458 RepID=UPI0034A28796
MSSEWPMQDLGSLISYRKGFAFKSKDYISSGVPIVRVSNFTDDSISPNDLKFVSPDIAKETPEVSLEVNDIVVATVGSWPNNPASVVGRTIRVPAWAESALMNQNSVIIRAKSKSLADQKFIYYQMRSQDFSAHVVSKAQGSANQASITLDAIFSYRLFWPKVEHRDVIVTFLSHLDDRIALLRETNTTLEAIAQALFKSWFVDFDPVHARARGEQLAGLAPEVAALFPNSFEESALGMIPKGWNTGTLGDVAHFQNGYAFKSKDWCESGHPVVKIGDVKPGIIDFSGCSYIAPETTEGLSRFKLRRGDLLVGMTGYVGETGLVPHVEPHAYLNQRVGRIATKSGLIDLGFVYCLVRNSAFKGYAEARSHGSAQANVSGAVLLDYPVVTPTQNILDRFNGSVGVLLERILSNHEQAQTLATLRDTLLPRLISGQLRLPEAEAMVEGAS